MIVAFGTSIPTSMTVVATSTSSSRAANASMTTRRSVVASCPCRQPDPEVAELGALKPFCLVLGGAGLDRLGWRHERAHHVGLPARREMRVSRV